VHADIITCPKLIRDAKSHLPEQIKEQTDAGEACAVKSDHCNIAGHEG